MLDEQKVADHLRRGTRFPGVSLDADGEVPCAIRGSVVSSNGNLVSKSSSLAFGSCGTALRCQCCALRK